MVSAGKKCPALVRHCACRHPVLLVWLFVFPLSGSHALAQEEIALFKLSDFSVEARFRYLLDDRDASDGVTRSDLWTEELWVRTKSYVYHPALLDMTVSGGPIFLQGTYRKNDGSNRESEVLFNYDADFKLLSRKQYPFAIRLIRDHSEMTTNLLGRFLARTDTFGASGIIRPTDGPLSANWSASHITSDGEGFGSTVDESIDQVTFGTSLAYGRAQGLSVSVNWVDRLSGSGSAGLPIQKSMVETLSTHLTGKNAFGNKGRVRLNQNARFFRQETSTAISTQVDRFSYDGHLNWRHTDRLDSRVNFSFRDEDRTSSWSQTRDGKVGATWRATERVSITGNGRMSRDQSPGFTVDRNGLNLTALYTRQFAAGDLSLSGSTAIGRTDQVAAVDTVQVFDEPHVLAGIAPVPLNFDFVVTETIVVTNVPQTQTFAENIDYRVVTIGSTTTIERIVTGNILDGQEVLVSYEYRAGGTAKYDTDNLSVSASFAFRKYANVYLQLSDSKNTVLSGINTVPLNDRTGIEAGAGLDFPLSTGWSVGGGYSYRKSVEDIAPADGDSLDVFLKTGHYWGTSAKVGLRKETVDNKFSDEDVNLLRYYVAVSCRLPGAAQFTYSYYSGEDDGGSVVRKDTSQNFQFDWRYRQVTFSLRARQTEVVQGSSHRDDTRVTAELRRSF